MSRCWSPNSGGRETSPTIHSLVIPVSDLDAAKAIYSALLGAPHTDQPYYVGDYVAGFEIALNPRRRVRWTSCLRRRRGSRRRPHNVVCRGRHRAWRSTPSRPGGQGCVHADADAIGLRGR